MNRIVLTLCLFVSTHLYAAEENRAIPEPPELPPVIENGEALEPDITIMRKGKETITQYRLNGELYMVKIRPDAGPPYYLIDSNGDGNMDVRRSNLERGMQVPQWVLFSW